MTPPRRPVFGFLWPQADPREEPDGVQVRAVRVCARGPIRLALLLLGSAATVIAAVTSVMAAAATGLTLPAILGAAACATAVFLLLRGWVVGTYVSDAAVRIERTFRRTVVAWSDVAECAVVAVRRPFLGLPVPVPARCVALTERSGDRHLTHVCTTSPDLWLRPEAFDVARQRLATWNRDQDRSR